jgi:two-component system, LuxR family, response regulator FixJ
VKEDTRSGTERVCAVVDDDASVRDSLDVLLHAYGFDVLIYASGAEFLADPRHRRIGWLILDQHMPGIDGLEVAATLQRQGVAVPTVLITGRLDLDIRRRAERLGVVGILEKPFLVARLVELLGAGPTRGG